jgi:hypothetical protein
MRIRVLILACGLVVPVGLAAPGQDPKAAPPEGVVPATFRAFLVTDGRFPPIKEDEGKGAKDVADPRDRTGKIHCLVCENGLAPVVAVFVRPGANLVGADAGVGKLVKGLDALIPSYRADKLAGFVMFLNVEGGKKAIKIPGEGGVETTLTVDQEYPDDEKRDEYAGKIRELAGALKAPNVPLGLAPTKSDAISAWKIGEADEVTVVVYYRMRVVGQPWRFAKLADLTDEKVAEILKSVVTAIGGKK